MDFYNISNHKVLILISELEFLISNTSKLQILMNNVNSLKNLYNESKLPHIEIRFKLLALYVIYLFITLRNRISSNRDEWS